MDGARDFPPTIDVDTVRLLAELNGLTLAPPRAAELAPFVEGIIAGGAALAALNLDALPATGLPWAPFTAAEVEDDDGD